MPLDLSIVIVSWNVADLLADCLASLASSALTIVPANGTTAPAEAATARPTAEVIVVDSASSDHTVAMLRERFSWVQAMAQDENIGFTRGNNLALAGAAGRYLLLLNPDTVVLDDALPTLIAYLDANPAVAIAGPRTLNTDGTVQSTRRRFPTLLTAMLESTWLQPIAPRGLLDRYYVMDAPNDGVVDVDWVQGSALMVRRAVYEAIGGLDEGYRMYSEELDWCRRAKLAGWRVVYHGGAAIIHHGGRSSDQAVARRHIDFNQSKLRYMRKYHGAFASQLVRTSLLLQFAAQLAIEAAKGAIGHKRAMRRDRVRVYAQVLRSGLRA